MDDSLMYTGNDGEAQGQFGNEVIDRETKEKLDEQRKQDAEILPYVETLIENIDKEIASVNSIKRFQTAAMTPEQDIRSELQAAALYEDYLTKLKSTLTLKKQEFKK